VRAHFNFTFSTMKLMSVVRHSHEKLKNVYIRLILFTTGLVKNKNEVQHLCVFCCFFLFCISRFKRKKVARESLKTSDPSRACSASETRSLILNIFMFFFFVVPSSVFSYHPRLNLACLCAYPCVRRVYVSMLLFWSLL